MIIVRERLRTLELSTLFSWFIIYSLIGWIYETSYCFLTNGRLMNRGFLHGPLIPIYGLSILAMVVLFSDRYKSVFVLFSNCAIVATILEYFSSVWMEKVFNRRWWNYSDIMFNIEGRVCLGASILFGICGVLFIKIIHPAVIRFLNSFSAVFLRKANRVILTLFVIDILLSFRRNLY